jgi:dTDP-4-dehydrorhamnose 3,5-epimerase
MENDNIVEFISLENLATQKLVEGVKLHPYVRARRGEIDPRGYLVELSRNDWTDFKYGSDPAAMTYSSFTYKGAARDEDQWHIHPHPETPGGIEQYDRWAFIGKAVAVVADPQTKELNLFKIGTGWGNSGFYSLLIPPHKYHGFLSVGGVIDDENKEGVWILNWPDRLYNYNDPGLVEGRVPYANSNINFPDASEFNWNAVRKALGIN